MLRRVGLLAIICERKSATIYLYDKEYKILIPLEQSNWTRGKSITVTGIISMLEQTKAHLLNITVYKKNAGLFFVQGETVYESIIDLNCAIQIAGTKTIPIFAEEKLIYQLGIHINKEMFIDLDIY